MTESRHTSSDSCGNACPEAGRREFLKATGGAAILVLLGDLFPNRVHAQDRSREALLTRYDRVEVVKLADLEVNQPTPFEYPTGHAAYLYRLGRTAGGGVGEAQDIVAFSTQCTHMGGDLADAQKHVSQGVSGPCPAHLTTFDLTRHGMVVAGHATTPLPQITLEVEDDIVYATGVLGLLYGHHENPAAKEV